MSARHPYRAAGVVTLLTLVALAAFLCLAPSAAGRVMQEDGIVEWLQVTLFGVAAVASLVAARRSRRALDVLLALLFATFVQLEVDFDRRLFGRPVIDKRFLLDERLDLWPRLLTFVSLLGLALVVIGYAWRRRAELIAAARALSRTPWGHVLLTGLGLLMGVEMSEKFLGRLLPLPKYFLEESLELLAALYCFIAVVEHVRHDGR